MRVSSEPGFLWRLEGHASHAFALLALLATLDFPWLVMVYISCPTIVKGFSLSFWVSQLCPLIL